MRRFSRSYHEISILERREGKGEGEGEGKRWSECKGWVELG